MAHNEALPKRQGHRPKNCLTKQKQGREQKVVKEKEEQRDKENSYY